MPTFRPLPPRPCLEYARKEAKALLRRIHAGDPEALSHALARHPQIDRTDPTRIRLADAQLVLAREHGFASWPRLVRYIRDVERQQHGHQQLHWGPDAYDAEARRMLAHHRARRSRAGRSLAAYVPRFYGLSLDEVFASTVTQEEARLAVARGYGAPSWEVFLERLEGNARTRPGDWDVDPMQGAFEAIRAADVGALERAVAAHPELLHPSEYDISAGRTLMGMALAQERKRGVSAMRPIMGWLAAQGLDRQRELNLRLCGHGVGFGCGRAVEVHELIDQGADPNWVAPNGIPALEHALLRYWSGEAVDVLAAHTLPRGALWIAAGLGDMDGVRGFLDAQGRPTPAARRIRPDCVAVGAPAFGPLLPEADDEEILVEALVVAILNGRTPVVEYLAPRGAPLNSLIYGAPLLIVAFNGPMEVVECLVRCGADLDLRSDDPNGTPRELVRSLFEQAPQDARRRQLVAACGMDAEALLAEINAGPLSTPEVHPTLRQALALASDDAVRLGQQDVRPENLLIGLMRAGGPPFYRVKEVGRLDVERFRTDLRDRIAPTGGAPGHPEPPMHPDTQTAMDAAIAFAAEQRHGVVYGVHLLHALTRSEEGPVGQILARYGVDVAKLHAGLDESPL
jgi:hypothetical protein